ncbi:hypothetical protein JST97_04715 [bacterium]|nr:hypothetical protein [bacterium]
MSGDKINRRRFLADLLFAGGAVTAAALLAQAGEAEKKPSPSDTPKATCTSDPNRKLDGDVALPSSPTPSPPEPPLGGKPMAPSPMVKGEVKSPQRQPKKP